MTFFSDSCSSGFRCRLTFCGGRQWLSESGSCFTCSLGLWLPAHAITAVNDKKKLDIKLKVALFFPKKAFFTLQCIMDAYSSWADTPVFLGGAYEQPDYPPTLSTVCTIQQSVALAGMWRWLRPYQPHAHIKAHAAGVLLSQNNFIGKK